MRRIVHQHEMREGTFSLHAIHDARKTRKVIIAKHIAVDDRENPGPDQRQGGRDATRGFKRLALARITQRHAKGIAVAQHFLDLVAQMGMIDHDAAKARLGQLLDVPQDERLARHGEKRLGGVIGERAHPFPSARRQNHCRFQNVYPTCACRFSSSSNRRAIGLSSV